MPDMMFQALDPTGLNETAEQVRAIVQAAKSEIEAELDSLDYAQPDGIYPEMTVGAVIGADETSQWAQRESTGTGSATVRSVQGAAVTWNQMCPAMSDSSWTEITAQAVAKSVTDEVMTLTFTNAGGSNAGVRSNKGPKVISGHKYYIAYEACQNTTGAQAMVNLNGSAAWSVLASAESTAGSDWARISDIFSINEDSQYSYICLYMKSVTSGSVKFRNVLCFDLTAMFGSGNEPTTVAEFERMYPASYYPYSAPTLKPVRIAGIQSKDAQGGELDSIEWETQTLRAAGSVADMLYSDHVDVRVGVVDLGTLTWLYDDNRFYARADYIKFLGGLTCIPYAEYVGTIANMPDKTITASNSQAFLLLRVRDDAYSDAATFKAAMSGVMLYYELATPTTQPISPALPMTYRVQAGGSESIIVPDGEVSAAPVLTVAEPVNMSTELARIWAAIEALQGSRGSALGSVRSDSDVSSTEVKEAPTMDEKQTTERESEA